MLHLTLMNHHFQVPCEDEERESLIEAATLLNSIKSPTLKAKTRF